MALELDELRKAEALRALQRAYADITEEELSDFRAEAFLDAVLKAVGPLVYDQAVQDVRAHMQSQLDDLEGIVRFED